MTKERDEITSVQLMFDHLLEELQEVKVFDCISRWDDVIPEDIWDKYFKSSGYTVAARELQIDKHRWFDVSTTVVSIFGRFLGIRGISKTYSDSMCPADCGVDFEFFEMKEKKVISYEPL